MKRSYLVKKASEVELNRMSRMQAFPGFPYISYKGSEIVKLAYSSKLVSRNAAVEALYRKPNRSTRMEIDMANKTLKDCLNKDYLKLYRFGRTFENLYTLGKTGFEYIGQKPYSTDFSRMKILSLYRLNQAFVKVCQNYREKARIEWVVEPEELGWEDAAIARIQTEEKTEIRVFCVLKSMFVQEQLEEVRRLADFDFSDSFLSNLSTKVYIMIKGSHSEPLLIKSGKERVRKDDEIREWILGGR